MPENPPLTDAEIARKYEIPLDHPQFRTARSLAHNRHDRSISEFPCLGCPHGGEDFVFAAPYVADEWHAEDLIVCPFCGRHSYVERVDYGTHDDDDQTWDGRVLVYLNTHPLEWFQ
jgi:hypothetical protein